MARTLKSDKVLFSATLLLLGLGVVMVYSASAVIALERYQQPYYFLGRQAVWATIGLGVLAAGMRIDYRRYRQPAFLWITLGLVGLALVAVLFRPPVNNARRWFWIGGFGVQPSEFAKLTAVFFIAALLERRGRRINQLGSGLLPVAVLVGVLAGLILLEPDFGTAIALAIIAATLVFAAGLSYSYFLVGLVVTLPPVAFLILTSDYRTRRVTTFLNPWRDPLGDGFQVIQSLIAVGTGGTFGRGLMQGVQKLFYLPEPHTDFIYSVIAEELGLIGALAVLFCFSVLAWRGLRVARRAPDAFGAYVALGLTVMVVVQALVNISVTLSLLPTKGIPLPLVSAGGSSMLTTLFGIGVLLNISQHATSADA
jgi:cell division protein FtsW